MSRRSRFHVTIMAASVAAAALVAHAQMKTVVQIAPLTIPAGVPEKSFPVDVRTSRAELLAAAKNRQQDVTLELDVEAERPPGVFYEVTIGAPRRAPQNIGNVALFGAGIRSEARGEFRPAHVQLVITDQLAAVLQDSQVETLSITFTAKGAERVPTAALTIDKAEIAIGPRLRR
jgi:hypothetical protein